MPHPPPCNNIASYLCCATISALCSFRCANEDFYVALGFSMCLTFLVWIGGGPLKRVLYFIGNESSFSNAAPASFCYF